MRLLSPSRAAEFLALSVRTLANWRVAGTGPAYCKGGGAVRYRYTDLQKYVESRIRSTEDAVTSEGRDVALPVLGERGGVHGQHRFGGYRTQQDRRNAQRSQSPGAGAGRSGS